MSESRPTLSEWSLRGLQSKPEIRPDMATVKPHFPPLQGQLVSKEFLDRAYPEMIQMQLEQARSDLIMRMRLEGFKPAPGAGVELVEDKANPLLMRYEIRVVSDPPT